MEIDKENVRGLEYVIPYGDKKKLGEMLNELKPNQAMIINYDMAVKNSVGVEPVVREVKLEKFEIKNLKTKLISLFFVAVMGVSGIAITNHINKPSMNDVSYLIGASVLENTTSLEKLGLDSEHASIAMQNAAIGENGVFYYHDAIAKDLLKVDESLFDYALCTVCNDFGNNIDNKVGIGERSNINAVIYYLKEYSSNPESDLFNEKIANLFSDVNTFNDFLVKRGFVDKDGGASLEAFREACDKNTLSIYDMLQVEQNSRGVGK